MDGVVERVPHLSQAQLLRLLEQSFPYVGIPHLQRVPMAALLRLRPIPKPFLRELSMDRELFVKLDPVIQRQVWELDPQLLRQHAGPLIDAFVLEAEAEELGLAVSGRTVGGRGVERGGEPSAPAGYPGGGAGPAFRGARKKWRAGCGPLRRLLSMVGSSPRVFQGVIRMCVERMRDSEGNYLSRQVQAMCTLRSQLLMAVHDSGAAELCKHDPAYKLAWCLDACLRDYQLGSVPLTDARIRDIKAFFQVLMRRLEQGGGAGGEDPDQSGSSTHVEEQSISLGEVGMILRDPPVLYMLGGEALRVLGEVVLKEELPRRSKKLSLITQLVQVAMSSRDLLREQSDELQKADQTTMGTMYPLLGIKMVDYQIIKLEADRLDESEPLAPEAPYSALLSRFHIARLVVQTFTIQRLSARDVKTAGPFLASMREVMQDAPDKSLVEWATFGQDLAGAAEGLFKAGLLRHKTPLWACVVDGLLLRTVETEAATHRAFLWFLSEVAVDIPDEALTSYITSCLKRTKKARRRRRRRVLNAQALGGDSPPVRALDDCGDKEAEAEDGVYAAYKRLAGALGARASPETIPELFQYLESPTEH